MNIYGAELETETHECFTNGAPAPVYKIRKVPFVWINNIRGSIVVSISACHAEDPGSIPGRGDVALTSRITRQRGDHAYDARESSTSVHRIYADRTFEVIAIDRPCRSQQKHPRLSTVK